MRQILMAAFNVVHDHGTDRIAELLCKTRGSVCHEVNPPVGSQAKLGLVDAAKITMATRDDRILRAVAEVCGYMLVPMPELQSHAEADVAAILRKCSVMAQEFAETMAALNEAMVDGRISQNELDKILRKSSDMVTTVNHLRALASAKADADQVRP